MRTYRIESDYMTHHLKRWATVIGRKAYLYERPTNKRNCNYTKPVFIGIQWFRSNTEALMFKKNYDLPLKQN